MNYELVEYLFFYTQAVGQDSKSPRFDNIKDV